MESIPERSNLPPLRKMQKCHTRSVEHQENREEVCRSPKSHHSSRIRQSVRNSGEIKAHQHYPGSTPINDNYNIQDPSNKGYIEFTNENGQYEFHGKLLLPQSSKRTQKWRRLLQKRPKDKNVLLPEALTSDALDDMIRKNGDMVFSSDEEGGKRLSELQGEELKREEERRMREKERRMREKEKKLEEEERAKLQQSRVNAMKELQMRRAKEEEEAMKRELAEEEQLYEKQYLLLSKRAIIDETPQEGVVTESIRTQLEKSKKRK